MFLAGFDVWMANTRGNTYSRGNLKYRAQDPKYWYFGLDELALIDLPTQIDFMLSSTGAKKTAFVGHSQVRATGLDLSMNTKGAQCILPVALNV